MEFPVQVPTVAPQDCKSGPGYIKGCWFDLGFINPSVTLPFLACETSYIMAHKDQQRDYSSDLDHSQNGHEKHAVPTGGSKSSAPAYPDVDDTNQGEVFDPYGGKKLGMFRVSAASSLYYYRTH